VGRRALSSPCTSLTSRLVPVLSLVLVACSGGPDPSPSGGSSGASSRSPFDARSESRDDPASENETEEDATEPPADRPSSDSCSVAEDCPYWYCECTGGIVNTRTCHNGRCGSAAADCTESCAAFDEEWTGNASR
jgi:hypothetical protein